MHHVTLHASSSSLLFHDWEEARALWDRFVRIDSLHALALMPDHVHLLVHLLMLRRIRQAMAAYTRWRQRERGWVGSVWSPLAEPVLLPNAQHQERTVRYVHLNPCRAKLVSDPLAWPFTTHRDAVGLAVPLVRPVDADPHRFHRYVSSDPSVRPEGTDLPVPPSGHVLPFEQVMRAVGALTRATPLRLRTRCPEQDLLIRAARVLTSLPTREIGDRLGLSHMTVCRIPKEPSPEVGLVHQVAGDPRFDALPPVDLRKDPGVQRYLRLRRSGPPSP